MEDKKKYRRGCGGIAKLKLNKTYPTIVLNLRINRKGVDARIVSPMDRELTDAEFALAQRVTKAAGGAL